MIKVLVFNEFRHEKDLNSQASVIYPEGIHKCIADFLSAEDDIEVKTVTLDDENCGISNEVLDDTDVLIWWGHMAQHLVPDEVAAMVQWAVLNGMGAIFLHSAHGSKPFTRLMGTSCALTWRESDDLERVWVTNPSHPIAQGLDRYFELPAEETYGEPFGIPEPDTTVFTGWYEGGEVFRSGCCWNRGNGKIFYFQPGHEMYPIYKDANVQKVIINAINSVDICTPNYLHSIIAVAAFEAGKHVFCEKPDAVNVEEVLKMNEAAKKAGKTLMVMRNNRFQPASQYAKKFIDAGKMGEIYAGRCGWQRRRGIPGKGGWFTTKAQSGGGPLIDLGVHMIDLAIWLMGNPTPVAVSGNTFCKFADTDVSDSVNSDFGDKNASGTFDVEDLAMGMIRFDNGAVLQIEFSWASNVKKERRFVELRGTKAGLKWEEDAVEFYAEADGELVDIQPASLATPNGHVDNLHHFYDCLLEGADPCFKPQQGIDMVKILCAVYESARTGKEVAL